MSRATNPDAHRGCSAGAASLRRDAITLPLPPHLRPELRGIAGEYWRGAARGELRLPRCRSCASLTWPPRSGCPVCGASEIEWVCASGHGVVHTFTVVRQAADPYFNARLPYVVAMVQLDEGPRLMSNITDCDVEAVHIGMPVAVAFVDAGDGLAVPVFTPSSAPTR
ncbi:MAG TPA: Zn-ribbon domain-containing OB-fold protein [Casimicrobiaceae bacterium]